VVEPDPVDLLELHDLGIPHQRVLRQMQPAHLPDLAEEVAAQPSPVELVEPFLGHAAPSLTHWLTTAHPVAGHPNRRWDCGPWPRPLYWMTRTCCP